MTIMKTAFMSIREHRRQHFLREVNYGHLLDCFSTSDCTLVIATKCRKNSWI